MPTFFNNSSARDHRNIYPVPFFDLNLSGRQATMAVGLKAGDQCVVATPTKSGEVVFQRFAFSHEEVHPDEKGIRVRVFYGKLIGSATLPKALAAQKEKYSVFFDVNGHFKRASVVGRKG